MAKSRIRKSIADLSPDDLRTFPVWEWAEDEEGVEGQDETFIRPVNCRVLHLDPLRQLHVAADFRTPDERHFEGIVTVSSDGIDTGLLFADSRGIEIPYDFWPKKKRKEFVKALQSTEKRIYPLAYRLRVPFSGEKTPYSGIFE